MATPKSFDEIRTGRPDLLLRLEAHFRKQLLGSIQLKIDTANMRFEKAGVEAATLRERLKLLQLQSETRILEGSSTRHGVRGGSGGDTRPQLTEAQIARAYQRLHKGRF